MSLTYNSNKSTQISSPLHSKSVSPNLRMRVSTFKRSLQNINNTHNNTGPTNRVFHITRSTLTALEYTAPRPPLLISDFSVWFSST